MPRMTSCTVLPWTRYPRYPLCVPDIVEQGTMHPGEKYGKSGARAAVAARACVKELVLSGTRSVGGGSITSARLVRLSDLKGGSFRLSARSISAVSACLISSARDAQRKGDRSI